MLSAHKIIEASTVYQPSSCKSDQNSRHHTEVVPTFLADLNFFSEDINWNELQNKLSTHYWVAELSKLNPERVMARFVEICFTYAKDYVLPRRPKSEGHRINKIPRDRRKLMRTRRRIITRIAKAGNSVTRITNLKRQAV